MTNKISALIAFWICCMLVMSCSDSFQEQDDLKNQISSDNIRHILDYIKKEYSIKYSDNQLFSDPKWDKSNVLINKQDTVLLTIPLSNNTENEDWRLVVHVVDNKYDLIIVKSPEKVDESIPMNIRRRIIVYQDGKQIVCKLVVNKNGEVRLARIRDTPITRSGDLNGGSLPEVVVWGGGSYETDWWWWDYMSGLINVPPPSYYTGYVPSPTSDPNTRPDYYKASNIVKSETVKKALTTMFNNTKNDASKADGRRERGFWVYYDAETKQYYTGTEKKGEYVKGGEGTNGSVSPGSPLPNQNGDHIPKTATPVTFIHTHTPLTYEEDCRREVGFSQSDIDYGNSNNIEMIVIDYVGTEGDDGKYYIEGGHDINAPSKEYIHTPNK